MRSAVWRDLIDNDKSKARLLNSDVVEGRTGKFWSAELVGLSPVHTSDNVAKNVDIVAETGDIVAKIRDIVAENGNNIEATLSKQLLVFNPVAMPPPLDFVFSWGGYKSMGLGTEVSSGV